MTRPAPVEAAGLIAAAGSGERLGGQAKAFVTIDGRTLLERAVALLAPFCARVLVGVAPADVGRAQALLGPAALVLAGGATRQETIGNLLRESGADYLVLHDVARPFVSPALVAAVLQAAAEHGAAAPVLPLEQRDSLALREGHYLGTALRRDTVVAIQTPYACRRELLETAYAAATQGGWGETSTTTLLVRAGIPVRLVAGEAGNVKITYPTDLETARTLPRPGS